MTLSKTISAAAVAFALLFAGAALGEEKHGVPVYPGAKYDGDTSGVLKEQMQLDAGCYRTADAVAKVTAFYKKQPGFEVVGESPEGSMLKKGSVDVTVQRPWLDMKTGTMHQDTLISIVKPKQ